MSYPETCGTFELIPAGKLFIRFGGRGRGVDDQIRVGPCALLKFADGIAQDAEVGIEDLNFRPKLRVVDLLGCESFDRETGKDNIRTVHLIRKAGKLVDLFGA